MPDPNGAIETAPERQPRPAEHDQRSGDGFATDTSGYMPQTPTSGLHPLPLKHHKAIAFYDLFAQVRRGGKGSTKAFTKIRGARVFRAPASADISVCGTTKRVPLNAPHSAASGRMGARARPVQGHQAMVDWTPPSSSRSCCACASGCGSLQWDLHDRTWCSGAQARLPGMPGTAMSAASGLPQADQRPGPAPIRLFPLGLAHPAHQ